MLVACLLGLCDKAAAQIDPEKRQLIQIGYNQPLEGHGPLAAYAFYYRNDPSVWNSNATLRLSIAPVYLDAELGFHGALGPNTDLGLGFAGGGFADSYYELRRGKFFESESFTGHGGELSFSAYHLFNPTQKIPLNLILHAGPHYAMYERDDNTSRAFALPEDQLSLNMRVGLRWGGTEPRVYPDLGMELSAWYEARVRTNPNDYGFSDDRSVNGQAHLFWARALFIYTLPHLKHNFGLSLTGGGSIDSDRFSAYRLGGDLPMSSEFPLTLPGYYFQEVSARNFVHVSGHYTVPLDSRSQWSITALGSVARVEYLRGLDEPNHVHSGVGVGLRYQTPKQGMQVILGWGYGFAADRSGHKGAQSLGILCQFDLEARHRPAPIIDTDSPYKSRGLFHLFQ